MKDMFSSFTRCLSACAVVGAMGFAVSTAEASPLRVQFDVDGLQTQAYAGHDQSGGTTGAFDTSFSGSLGVSYAASSSVAMLIGGADQGISTGGWSLSDFSATINFDNGTVVGGQLSLSVTDGVSTDYFTANVSTSAGGQNIFGPFGSIGYTITGNLQNGEFSGDGAATQTFAGVDISSWYGLQGIGSHLFGSLFQFGFTPDGTGFDGSTDINVFVAIPLPAPILMGLVGLVPMILLKRRFSRAL